VSLKTRLLLAPIIICACGGSAQAVLMIDGVSSSSYEQLALRPEYSASGYLDRLNNGSWEPGGSFSLIDTPRPQDMGFWGTTAAHVAYSSATTLFDGFRAGFGSNQLNDSGPLYAVDAVIPFPTYSRNDALGSTPDIALVHFSSKVEGVTPATRFRGTDQTRTVLTRIGYGTPGYASTGLGTYDGVERASNNMAMAFGLPGSVITDYWDTWFAAPGWPFFQALGGMGTPGDSGGGSYATIGGTSYLVGISSFYKGSFGYGGDTFSLRVSLYNDWIDQTIASYVPEPATISLLLLAVPLLARRRRAPSVLMGLPVLAAAFALCPGPSAQAAVMRDDVPSSEYEAFAADMRFNSVGCIYTATPNGSFRGSGVLIAPQWVLTAGHMMVDDLGGGPVSEMRFYTGTDINNYDHLVYADAWSPFPGYSMTGSPAGVGSDIGLVHLATPITDITPAERFWGTDQPNTTLYMAGYGKPGIATGNAGANWLPFDGKKRAGSNVGDHFGGIENGGIWWIEPQYWTVRFDPPGWGGEQPLEWQSSPGDSGGGWFADINGRSQLVGINDFSVSSIDYGYNSRSAAIRVSLYNDWIDQVTGLPEPATVGLLLLAVPLLARRRRAASALAGLPLLLAVFALCPGPTAHAVVMHDNVPSSEYEALAAQAQYAPSGYLNCLNNGVYEPAGSGVLIDAGDQTGFWVLTAGHVILNSGTEPFAGFQFGLGSNQFDDPRPLVAADVWFPFPGYSDADPWGTTPDLGLVHLSSAVNDVPAATRFRGTDQAGTLLTRVGHGKPGTPELGLLPYDGVERATDNIGFRFGVPGIAITDYWTTRFDGPGWPYYQHLGGHASPGDSGGASYATIAGQDYLVGITSFRRGDYSYGDSSYALRVSLYNDWIDQTIANYTPEPTSFLLLLLAMPLLSRRKAA